MPHSLPLITTIVAGLGLAFIFGALANRLKLSPLVGYLVAGIVVGPATPGFVADMELVPELAEIGVILLMFGVGLHFSLHELLAVRLIAVPGAVVQIGIATVLGWALALALGWPFGHGIVFGLALSVASTVVLLRALQERRLVETERGRIAVGWLIVEDLAMVLALVLLPALSGLLGGIDPATGEPGAALSSRELLIALGLTVGKIVAFVVIMLVVGRRVIPWILHVVAHTGSRELFRLGVLAIALGVAFGAAMLFDVSFALGAFFAGMIMSESTLSQQAAQESLPLRDAFAVLFFVSVGMLFDPAILIAEPLAVIGTLAIIVFGKSLAAFALVMAFGRPRKTALTIAASLAQIGEFSFILAGLGLELGLLTETGQDLILAGAILSIVINPFLFSFIDRMGPEAAPQQAPAESPLVAEAPPKTGLTGHSVVVGYGRVGKLVADALEAEGLPYLVIEDRGDVAMPSGTEHLAGNAVLPEVLDAANVAMARVLFVAIPELFEAGQVIHQARTANRDLVIIARAHSDAEVDHLYAHGASLVVMGERETAKGMVTAWRELAASPPAAAEAGA